MENLMVEDPTAAEMQSKGTIRIAKVIAGINMLILLGAIFLMARSFQELTSDGDAIGGIAALVNFLLAAIVYSLFAILIISRYPKHLIGWLFLFFGFVSALFLLNIGSIAPTVQGGNPKFLALSDFAGEVAWMLAAFLPITLTLQFFPNGRLPSPRWWPVPAATILGILGQIISIAFHPWPWEQASMTGDFNPMAIEGGEKFFESLYSLTGAIFTFALIGSLAAVVVRFYRSRGIERQQMKWLVYTSIAGFSSILLLNILPNPSESLLAVLFIFQPTILAIAIGIAILRYRLFDIDILIRKTLQYAILTGVLAAIYFGLVIALQSVFASVGDQQSPIFIVVSTLVIAALFNPLRRRIQEILDQRFYRKKYQAEQALAQFSLAARDKVDLDELSTELLAVVRETIQPETISLWLAGSNRGNSR